jgi:GT2 family glycosyltransferase
MPTEETISVVIPTKDRHSDLCTAIESIAAQTTLPNELLLIDQSKQAPSEAELRRMHGLLGPSVALRWIHDPSIRGLVHAKKVGVSLASGDLIFFLEDDIVLEREFIRAMREGFQRDSHLVGASGVVTDVPFGRAYACCHALFHRGMFSDPRPWIYATLDGRGSAPIPSQALSGGLSAWRRQVFNEVQLDTDNGFHMLEDLDFSTRVRSTLGDCMAILPGARLEHHFAPGGRAGLGLREKKKVVEFITFFRTRPRRPSDYVFLAWLLVGVGAAALASSVRHLTWRPCSGGLTGLSEGFRRNVFPVKSSSAETSRNADPD